MTHHIAAALRGVAMLRKRVRIVAFTVVVPIASVYGQAAPEAERDVTAVCETLGAALSDAELVFTGRAQLPVTVRTSGEAEIEQARENLVRIMAEVARLRASLDPQTRLEREREFVIRIIEAESVLDRLRAFYPPPEDLRLVPVYVEQAFRGVTASMVMLWARPLVPELEVGALYLIAGYRTREDITDFEIVNVRSIKDVESTPEELRLLASISGGATISGSLRMQSFGHRPGAALGGVRIQVASGTQVVETLTNQEGTFTVSGIRPGRLQMNVLLHQDLTVVDKPGLTFELREGGCKTLNLRAALNGRVRGRIVGATGRSFDGVNLVLQGRDSSGHMFGDHLPQSTVRPNEDGTFEFSGQSPGSYILSAGLETVVDGKRRYLTTYFPGTADLAAAVPIIVDRATLHDGFVFLVRTE